MLSYACQSELFTIVIHVVFRFGRFNTESESFTKSCQRYDREYFACHDAPVYLISETPQDSSLPGVDRLAAVSVPSIMHMGGPNKAMATKSTLSIICKGFLRLSSFPQLSP